MNKEGIKQISTWEKLLKIKEIAEKEIDSKDEESLLEKKYKEEINKCKFSEKYRCFERPENCSRTLEDFKVRHLVTKNLTFKSQIDKGVVKEGVPLLAKISTTPPQEWKTPSFFVPGHNFYYDTM